MIAQALDTLANQLYPDTAVTPSGASTTNDPEAQSSSTNATDVAEESTADVNEEPSSTASSDEIEAEGTAEVATPDEETAGTFEMTSNLLEKCRLAMLFIDKDRDNNLGKDEFELLVDRLKTEIEGGISYRRESDVYDAHYETMKETLGGVPSLLGSKPTHVPTVENTETLTEICRGTYEAMEEAKRLSGEVVGKDDVHLKQSASVQNEAIQLDPEALKECKRSIYVSDRDRNGGLDVDEFVFLLNRISGKDTYYGFVSVHEVFHELYKDFSSYSEAANSFMISSSGSKPGTIATVDETYHLESVCEAIFFAFKEISVE